MPTRLRSADGNTKDCSSDTMPYQNKELDGDRRYLMVKMPQYSSGT